MNKIFFSGVALLLVLSTILSQNNVHAASNKLHVHIIPHSHCDPGWLKTFTEYYNDHVRNILNGVVDNLQRDPKKTFNWAEISFFQLWWNEQSLEKKEELTKLVEEGRFEFIGGGVVQNDEADSSVDVVINQVTDGHDFLLRHFNTRPRIAWQVDPFGHSALTPTLFSLVGYEAMVINRIHHQLKSNYKRSKNMEFIWRASPSYGESTEMFTHVLHTHYSAPMGYDWEEGSPGIEEYNIANRATDLANAMKSRSEAYQTDQLLVPWGDDFKFQNAGWQYSNMDKLIKYISEHPELGVEISYSTLSRYFDAVHESATKNQVKFPVCDGDFFPYADNEDSYWTGYYTSRPLLKNQHRETLSVLRSTEILYALTRVETKSIDSSSVISWDSTYEQIQKARWDADLVSHHDGVTGTSRSRVVQDYLNRLASGVSDCQSISATTASLLLAKDPSNRPQLSGSSTDTVYELDEGQSYAIVYQNPVAWKRTSIVTVRVNTQAVRVLDSEGSHVISQVLPIYGRDTVGKPNDDSAVDEYEIAFTVDAAPLGLRTYFLQKSTDKEYMAVKSTVTIYANNPVPGIREMKQFTSSMNIANDNLQINFGMEGFPEKLIHKTDNTESDFRINYLEYMTSRSGAYIFRSEGRQPTSLSSSNNRLYVSKGPLVNQAVVFADKNDLRIRLYNESELTDAWIDLSHRVVPSGNNRELIVRYSTSLETDTSFFTDDGIEMRARTASHRASSRSETDYFPVQSAAFIQDENQEFVVLTKQVMGATSDKSGSLELMLHRALGQDDGRGLSEAMQDFTPYTTPHWLLFGNIPATERLRQRYSIFLEHPLRTFSGEVEDIQEWTSNYHTIYETISHDFPYNIHLRTFQVRDSFSDELVVRLSHLYEDGIHAILSKETEVPLTSLFSRYKFSNVRRVSLSTTRDLPPDQLVPTKKKFQSNGERLPLLTETDPGVREYGSKQNSEEEGVFLSKIALDLEDQKEEQPQENRRRRLLQVDTSGVSFDVVLYPIETHTFLTELTPAIELGDYVSAKYSNVTLPKHSWAKRAVGGVFNDQTRRRNQNLAEHALQQNYVGNYEIKTMLLFTVLGVGLMLGVFLRLQRRNVKKPSPV